MKAIIFGADGQDGHYLRKLYEREQVDCLCTSIIGERVIGDISDYSFVEKQIKEYQPNHVIHFAANSTTRHAALFENHATISTGTLNLLEAVRQHCPEANIFLSGSAMQFENKGVPIDEKTPFEASSPYSIARIQSVYAARYYRDKFGLRVYVGYFFNHDSPLRPERHVNQKIARTALRIANGSDEKLVIGNYDVKKEFNYAGDIVEAIWILMNQNNIYEAVIGSGIAHSIKEWIECCFKKLNLNWLDHTVVDNKYEPEYELLVSNPQLIKSLGWKPKTNLSELANLFVQA